MFNRLAAIRMKTAEKALAEGRLEEALEIATSPDLTGHRSVQRLLAEMAERFMQRGQDHLLGRRFDDAVADFGRAGRCGTPPTRVEEWRQRALAARHEALEVESVKRAAYEEARQRLAQGSIAGAEGALARSPIKDAEAAALSEQIARQERRALEAIKVAEEAIQAGQIGEAAQQVLNARGWHAKLEGIAEVERRLTEVAVARAMRSFAEGRIPRAEQELAELAGLGRGHSQKIDMEERLRLAHEAAKALADGRYDRAHVLMGRLERLSPSVGWIDETRASLEVLEEKQRSLMEGPLGAIAGRGPSPAVNRVAAGSKQTQSRALVPDGAPPRIEPLAPANGHLPRRMLLRVDGVGSFLLLRGDRIGIGRAGPGASADLQLISDLSERQAEIIRAGEDYFLIGQKGVELAGLQVEHALLAHGDRIRLGSRVKLRFLRPSRKSPAAVLELGEGVRTTSDCRQVILWSGPVLFGNRQDCHVRFGASTGGLVLMESDGRMVMKALGGGVAEPVALGKPLEMAGLRFSVQAG